VLLYYSYVIFSENATVFLTSFVGGGAAKIATTTYHIVFPGIGEGFLTMTDEGCYPGL
jgi:hypothetical protein